MSSTNVTNPVRTPNMVDLARKHIYPRYRPDFLRFVETGESSDEFFAYLDTNPEAQKGIEEALKLTSVGLERLRDALAADVSLRPVPR